MSGEGKGKAIFRNYKAYLDTVDIYELIANDWNALRGIKFNFKYDYWYKGKVKNIYKDEFNRIVKVKKIKPMKTYTPKPTTNPRTIALIEFINQLK